MDGPSRSRRMRLFDGKWWEIYNEPELNALEEELNIDNQNIRQYFENFMEARALVREARSQYFPTVSVGPSYTRSQTSSNIGSGSNGNSGTGGGTTTTTTTTNHHRRQAIAAILSPARSIVGARSLGQSPQHRARQPI